MYYQYELTHFKGDMGHGVASDAASARRTHVVTRREWEEIEVRAAVSMSG